MRALSVYLDSSDYSYLSNPRTQCAETEALRARLQVWSDSGRVKFWYSAAHITEMAPLDLHYTAAANARADLLVGLCARNALISFDRLLEIELAALRDRNGPPIGAHSSSGDWFPEISGVAPPLSQLCHESALAEAAAHLNRDQRRQLRKRSLRGGKPRRNLWRALTPEAIIAEYPMRPEDAAVLRDYVAGKATAKQAEDAFVASLRDPNWMMRWFARHSDAMTPIIEWMRGPARQLRNELTGLTNRMSALLCEAKELQDKRIALGVDRSALGTMLFPDMKNLEDRVVLSVARGLITRILKSKFLDFKVDELDRHAPGLATALHTFFQVVYRSVGATPRKLKDSDFVDVVHCMYAPYVDIFRTDAFMAPLVKKAAGGEFIVVSRLTDLPHVIDEQLRRRGLV